MCAGVCARVCVSVFVYVCCVFVSSSMYYGRVCRCVQVCTDVYLCFNIVLTPNSTEKNDFLSNIQC